MKFYEPNFSSRRSVVMSQRGMAASSQPLAVEAAVNVLRQGGNAMDAAVTATAVLMVIEPMSTGLGGDCFALIYQASEQPLTGLNASGRAPRRASADAFIESGQDRVPLEGPLSVTVPGALAGLAQCLARHGTISLAQALAPAIFYAEGGFPVTEVTAQLWHRGAAKLARYAESTRVYLPHGQAPSPGQTFRNPDLARTLKLIAERGPEEFYRGEIGKAIAASVRDLGGVLSFEDLTSHTSDWCAPIKTTYRGQEIVELPPNNQGLAALIALNLAEGFPLLEMRHHSTAYLHTLIEAMKLALADAHAYIADPDEPIQLSALLSKQYAAQRRAEVSDLKALAAQPGTLPPNGDTVYVAVVDEQRNAVSLISSLYKAFGSGITVPGTGLLLQNRGACFTLAPDHPNRLAPGKRPFHTIMPAMILREGKPWACFGVVGGMMQAQAHLQVVSNLIDFEMNPQAALDAPRFRILEDGHLALEAGIPESVGAELAARGHRLQTESTEEGFGGGQIILIAAETLYGGSDPRKDGCALGY
jgi:gamma-glutamyltranspeptidase/glutathione hydrolase